MDGCCKHFGVLVKRYKTFHTQMSMKFQLLIGSKILKKNSNFSCLKHSDFVFILLINVKCHKICWHFKIYVCGGLIPGVIIMLGVNMYNTFNFY